MMHLIDIGLNPATTPVKPENAAIWPLMRINPNKKIHEQEKYIFYQL
jgi:hypothetical protein